MPSEFLVPYCGAAHPAAHDHSYQRNLLIQGPATRPPPSTILTNTQEPSNIPSFGFNFGIRYCWSVFSSSLTLHLLVTVSITYFVVLVGDPVQTVELPWNPIIICSAKTNHDINHQARCQRTRKTTSTELRIVRETERSRNTKKS